MEELQEQYSEQEQVETVFGKNTNISHLYTGTTLRLEDLMKKPSSLKEEKILTPMELISSRIREQQIELQIQIGFLENIVERLTREEPESFLAKSPSDEILKGHIDVINEELVKNETQLQKLKNLIKILNKTI